MKRESAAIFLLSVLILSTLPLLGLIRTSGRQPNAVTYTRQAHPAYVSHAPIVIDDDSDFATQGWPGSGTEADPYVIEGLNITTEGTCIDIRSTTVYFVIRNCLLVSTGTDSQYVIYLRGVSHGRVESSTLIGARYSVFMSLVSDISATNIVASGSGERAAYAYKGGDLVFDNWTVHDKQYGITCVLSDNVNVTNSRIWAEIYGLWYSRCTNFSATENSFYGCSPSLDCRDRSQIPLNMTGNTVNDRPLLYLNGTIDTVVDTSNYGSVILTSTRNVTLSGGIFSDVSVGIQTHFCENTSVAHVSVSDCVYGIFVGYSNWTAVSYSTFSDFTSAGVNVGASCMGLNVTGCTFTSSEGVGIGSTAMPEIRINSNVFVGCGVREVAHEYQDWPVEMWNNTVNSKPLGYLVNQTDLVVDGSEYGQLYIVGCVNTTVTGGTFKLVGPAVTVGLSNLTFVRDVEVDGMGESIWGIMGILSNNFTIADTMLKNFGWYGVYLEQVSNVTVDELRICRAETGIACTTSQVVRFTNCRIWNCTGGFGGIWLYNTENSTLVNNTIFGCSNYGVWIRGTSSVDIYGNKFGWNAQNAADDSGVNWDNSVDTGNAWSDYEGVGDYVIGGTVGGTDHYPLVLTDDTPPEISSPPDAEFEEGDATAIVTWDVSDQYPHYYEVYRNGSLVESASFCCQQQASVHPEGTAGEIWNYTVVAYDYAGNKASDTVFVHFTPATAPSIDHPDDITFTQGVGTHIITWHPSSVTPDSYVLYVNGTVTESGPWDGSAISVEVSDLTEGVYNYTLFVNDTRGLSASDTVIVTVTPQETTTTTTGGTTTGTTSETTTETTAPGGPPLDPLLVIALVAGVVGAVVVVLVVINRRRSKVV